MKKIIYLKGETGKLRGCRGEKFVHKAEGKCNR